LFGGFGYGSTFENTTSGYLNDLWRYTPSNNQWTWMSGDNHVNPLGKYGVKGIPDKSNVPGGRSGALSWIDKSGNLWLFGGYGYGSSLKDEGSLNDLWRYTPSNNQWAWMGGESTRLSKIDSNKFISATNKMPRARYNSIGWRDKNGNLWLFGGMGSDSRGLMVSLNDFWYFTPFCEIEK